MVWTVEPSAVRRVAVRAAALAARIDPELIRTRAQRLESGPAAPPADLANVMALMHRTIAYLAAAP